MNRTDVETPSRSTGVRPPTFDMAYRGQRSAKIGQADMVPLTRLPDSAWKRYRAEGRDRSALLMGTADDALPLAVPCLRPRLPPRPRKPLHPLYPRGLVAAGAAAA